MKSRALVSAKPQHLVIHLIALLCLFGLLFFSTSYFMAVGCGVDCLGMGFALSKHQRLDTYMFLFLDKMCCYLFDS